MGLFDWMNKQEKKLDILDIVLIKWTVLFFAFLIAKTWPVVISLDWYWYLGLGILVMLRPLHRFYLK